MSPPCFRYPSRLPYYPPPNTPLPKGYGPLVIHGKFPCYIDENDTRFYTAPIPATFTNVLFVPLNLLSNLRAAVLGTTHHAFHMNNLQRYLGDYLESVVNVHIKRTERDGRYMACYNCDAPAETYIYRSAFNFNTFVRDYAEMVETVKATFAEGYFFRPEVIGETVAREMIEKDLFPVDFLSVEVIPSCPLIEEVDPESVPGSFSGHPRTECTRNKKKVGLEKPIDISEMMEGWIHGLRCYVVGKLRHSGFGFINYNWEIYEDKLFRNDKFQYWEDCEEMESLLGKRRCENFCGKEGQPTYKCGDCEMVWFCSSRCQLACVEIGNHPKNICERYKYDANQNEKYFFDALKYYIIKNQEKHAFLVEHMAAEAQARAEQLLRNANKPKVIWHRIRPIRISNTTTPESAARSIAERNRLLAIDAARLAEQNRLEAEMAEQNRVIAEKAVEARLAYLKRAEAEKAGQARVIEVFKKARSLAEQNRLEAEKAEEARLADLKRAEAKKADQARVIELVRKAREAKFAREAARAAELKRVAEVEKSDKARLTEFIRSVREAKFARDAEQAAEEKRAAEAKRAAAEAEKSDQARLIQLIRSVREAKFARDAEQAAEAKKATEAEKSDQARVIQLIRSVREAKFARDAEQAAEAKKADEAMETAEAVDAMEADEAMETAEAVEAMDAVLDSEAKEATEANNAADANKAEPEQAEMSMVVGVWAEDPDNAAGPVKAKTTGVKARRKVIGDSGPKSAVLSPVVEKKKGPLGDKTNVGKASRTAQTGHHAGK